MTDLAFRLAAAANALELRYGSLASPIAVPLNGNDTFNVGPSPPLILEQGQIKITLSQVVVGQNLHNLDDDSAVEIHLSSADAEVWCNAVESGSTAAINHNSSVLLYESGSLTVGVGPGYVGDASGNLFYSVAVYGPIPVTTPTINNLINAIRSILSTQT